MNAKLRPECFNKVAGKLHAAPTEALEMSIRLILVQIETRESNNWRDGMSLESCPHLIGDIRISTAWLGSTTTNNGTLLGPFDVNQIN